jgi:glycosyltransferase involved in cell wall biosynthesis
VRIFSEESMPQITIMLPIYCEDQDVKLQLECLAHQSLQDLEILVVDSCGRGATSVPAKQVLEKERRAIELPGLYDNIAAMRNHTLSQAQGEIFLELPPNIRLCPEAGQVFLEAAQEKPKAAMFYADYQEVLPDGRRERKKLMDFFGDITERFDFGQLRAYRTETLRELAGWDEGFNSAHDYDLQLRLMERYEILQIPQVLYHVQVSQEEREAASIGASKLFFPGTGKYGGFSYLFYDEKEEREIERACYDMLKRRGAFLEHDNQELVYGPDERFEVLASVVIPVYNRERFIDKAIDSVLRGTLKEIEVVVVDNGSTDGTKEVVRKIAQRDSRVRLIENDENIIALSLNLGWRAARGKYIAQLDSDDEYLPETLQAMTDHLESHPRAALAVSYYDLMDEKGNILEEFGVIKHLEYSRNNIMRCDGAGAVRVWHKRVIAEFGGFDEEELGHYGEDYDLVLKVTEKYDLDRVHQVLYRYRRHPDNTDARRDERMKLWNKTVARQRALKRRKELNRKLGKART